MSELAFNINGETFEVPPTATGWRVKRMKLKGAPEVVYGRDGLPLVVPINADVDDLKAEVDVSGRYRLDLVDQHTKALPDVPSGYVHVTVDTPAERVSPAIAAAAPSNNVTIEAMRLNSELAHIVLDRFPQMMEAAAELIRAADGAGLPARQPRAIDRTDDEDDDDDDDDDDRDNGPASSPGLDLLNTVVAQVVPLVVTALAGKKLNLGAMLDWRKASPQPPTESATPALASKTETATEATNELPPLDPKMMSHFIAIQSALTPAEAALARQVAAELSPAEMRAWFHEMSALSVPDAVAKIRAIVGATRHSTSVARRVAIERKVGAIVRAGGGKRSPCIPTE